MTLINRTTIQQILSQYAVQKNYCDMLWNRTFTGYSSHMQCRKGCSQCCILQSVNILEAYIIFRNINEEHPKDFTRFSNTDFCVFLSSSGDCTIYQSRPLLCRTHGLLLKSSEFIGNIARSCELNFIGNEEHPDGADVNINSLSVNTEKLCCVFALAAGDLHLSSIRIRLEDIRSGSIHEPLKELFLQ